MLLSSRVSLNIGLGIIMAWLLLALFIGIGFLFAISSYFDAPSSPSTPPIPEDTASENPFTSGAVKSRKSIFDDIDTSTDLDPVPEIKRLFAFSGWILKFHPDSDISDLCKTW